MKLSPEVKAAMADFVRPERDASIASPEIIDGESWDVVARPGGGSVDLKQRVFYAPAKDNPVAGATRKHERLHIKYTTGEAKTKWDAAVEGWLIESPSHWTKVDPIEFRTSNGFEDCRINHAGVRMYGREAMRHLSAWNPIDQQAIEHSPEDVALCVVARYPIYQYNGELERVMKLAWPAYVRNTLVDTLASIAGAEGYVRYGSFITGVDDYVTLAREWEDRLEFQRMKNPDDTPEEPGEPDEPGDGDAGDADDDDFEGDDGEDSPENSKSGGKDGSGQDPWRDGLINPEGRSDGGEWAAFDGVLTAPLVKRHAAAAKALRKPRPSDIGGTLRYPQNAHPHGSFRVYGRKVKAPGGTILIDASGSMKINQADIESALEQLPAACVAIYSGDGQRGHVTIIADKGRMADADGIDAGQLGFNSIDGPALEWLAQRKGPKAWVCDGAINGLNRRPASKSMTMQVNRLMERARIPRYETLSEATKGLKTGMVEHKRVG